VQVDGAALKREGAQAIELLSAEGAGLEQMGRAVAVHGDLAAQDEVGGEQVEPLGDPVGMQAVADHVVQVVTVQEFFDGLLDPVLCGKTTRQSLRLMRAWPHLARAI
jgi:hypothetical protein